MIASSERTVHLPEHIIHAFNVVVVEEPGLWVLLILLERDTEGVGDVDSLAVVLS